MPLAFGARHRDNFRFQWVQICDASITYITGLRALNQDNKQASTKNILVESAMLVPDCTGFYSPCFADGLAALLLSLYKVSAPPISLHCASVSNSLLTTLTNWEVCFSSYSTWLMRHCSSFRKQITDYNQDCLPVKIHRDNLYAVW